MNVSTIIAIAAVAALLLIAILIIYKNRKQGKACVGCPYAGSCSGKCAKCDRDNTERMNKEDVK